VARKSTRKSPAKNSTGAGPSRTSPRKAAAPGRARAEAAPRRRGVAAEGSAPAAVEDLRPTAEAPRFGDIPWAYGDDRVTAMARDPSWIFVYWELTDEAIARARQEVQDPGGWCVLRVYDTTYRHFDGTNANWYVDIAVHREANNYYVPVHRPGATIHVDIGIKSHEGWFAKIARSSGVEMPRDGISWDTRAEWMTVWPEAAPPPEYVHRFVPRPGTPGVDVRTEAVPESEIAGVMQSLVGEGWSRTEWTETAADGRIVRWMRWTGPFWREHWRTMADGRTTVEVIFHGERTIVRTTWGERVIVGPWLVTIHGASVQGRRVIDRWSVHYSWITEEGRARVETDAIVGRMLGQVWAAGMQAGSEARLVSGLGASEWLAAGASEWRWIGASEARLGGASERIFLGASEWRYLGGSETLGASERLFMGASGMLGASEGWQAGGALGGSEGLGPAGSDWPRPAREERS
jgi:hypothetical protein